MSSLITPQERQQELDSIIWHLVKNFDDHNSLSAEITLLLKKWYEYTEHDLKNKKYLKTDFILYLRLQDTCSGLRFDVSISPSGASGGAYNAVFTNALYKKQVAEFTKREVLDTIMITSDRLVRQFYSQVEVSERGHKREDVPSFSAYYHIPVRAFYLREEDKKLPLTVKPSGNE